MKKTGYITASAIFAALSVTVMLISHFPFLTYSLPAIASLFIMVAVIELGAKWALGSYIVAAALTGLFAEREAALLFILFFGYYPIIKLVLERIKNIILRYAAKLLIFNGVIAVIYLLLLGLLGLETEFVGMAPFMVYGMWAAANVVFVLYDILIVRLSNIYMWKLHSQIERFIKK